MVTDVDTDELLAKKRRRITASKHIISSSDSEKEDAFAGLLAAYLRQPVVQQLIKLIHRYLHVAVIRIQVKKLYLQNTRARCSILDCILIKS